jgi:deoxyribonuclease-4
MKFHIGPHIPLEKTVHETLDYFTKEEHSFNSPSAIQTFIGVPVSYNLRKFHHDSLVEVKDFCKKYDKRWYIHAPYVINLASQEETILKKSRTCLQKILDIQAVTEQGTVVHIGTKGPLSQVIKEINDLRFQKESQSRLYLENAAQYAKLGKNKEELRLLLEGIDSSKVGFCYDTCHLHSSGTVDMRNTSKVVDFFEEMKDYGLRKNHCVIHLNDSKTVYKSGQDRHAVLGYGHIWNVDEPTSFDSLFALRDVCKENEYDIILETPSINIEEYELKILKN